MKNNNSIYSPQNLDQAKELAQKKQQAIAEMDAKYKEKASAVRAGINP